MKNNKGFSLVELIIVIAILAVVTSASFVGFGYLFKTNVKNTVKKINTSLHKTQNYTTSKSSGGRDIGMRLTVDSSGNYCVQNIYNGVPEQQGQTIGKSNLTLKCYKTDGSVTTVGSTPVDIYFDRSTGGLLPADESAPDVYWSKIEILVNGTGRCTITISKITGKTETTYFQ